MEMLDRLQEGIGLTSGFLSVPGVLFSDLKPSMIPAEPGVYAIFHKDTDETLYVGRTKNLRQRLYSNHLHGPATNARLKKYLAEDENEPDIKDLADAKDYLKKNCYFRFMIEPDTLKRGRFEGLLSYMLNVRYMYEEH